MLPQGFITVVVVVVAVVLLVDVVVVDAVAGVVDPGGILSFLLLLVFNEWSAEFYVFSMLTNRKINQCRKE